MKQERSPLSISSQRPFGSRGPILSKHTVTQLSDTAHRVMQLVMLVIGLVLCYLIAMHSVLKLFSPTNEQVIAEPVGEFSQVRIDLLYADRSAQLLYRWQPKDTVTYLKAFYDDHWQFIELNRFANLHWLTLPKLSDKPAYLLVAGNDQLAAEREVKQWRVITPVNFTLLRGQILLLVWAAAGVWLYWLMQSLHRDGAERHELQAATGLWSLAALLNSISIETTSSVTLYQLCSGLLVYALLRMSARQCSWISNSLSPSVLRGTYVTGIVAGLFIQAPVVLLVSVLSLGLCWRNFKKLEPLHIVTGILSVVFVSTSDSLWSMLMLCLAVLLCGVGLLAWQLLVHLRQQLKPNRIAPVMVSAEHGLITKAGLAAFINAHQLTIGKYIAVVIENASLKQAKYTLSATQFLQYLAKSADLLRDELTGFSPTPIHGGRTVAFVDDELYVMLLPVGVDPLSYEQISTVITETLNFIEVDKLNVFSQSRLAFVPLQDCQSAQSLIQQSRFCLMHAARQNTLFCVYSKDYVTKIAAQAELIHSLQKAIEAQALEVYFQPQICLSSSTVLGAEALVRWWHQGKFMPPNEFIPLAEQAGLINQLTELVVEKALWQLRELIDAGFADHRLSINVSGKDLLSQHLPVTLYTTLLELDIPAANVTIELTESAAFAGTPRALMALRELHAIGVKVAIDDYGTGYSSLAYLADLHFDELKVDMRFVRHMDTSTKDRAITETTIKMAKMLNMHVVAEGVENAEVASWLKLFGCDIGQGYHYSKPLPFADYLYYLQSQTGVLTEKPAVKSKGIAMDLNLSKLAGS